MYVNMGKI